MAFGCCCGICIIGEDKFSANDGRPHSGWTNRPAIYSTAAGDEATNTGGVFHFHKPNVQKFNTAHPDGASGKFHVRVKVKLTQIGSDDIQAVVIIGYLNDTTYLAAYLLYQSDGCSFLSIGEISAATCNSLNRDPDNISPAQVPIRGLTLDQWHTLDVCLIPNNYGAYGTGDTLRASVKLADGTVWGVQTTCDAFTGGAYVGLGSGNDATTSSQYGEVDFDDFKFNYFRGDGHLSCPNCNTPCAIFSDPFTDDFESDVIGQIGCFWKIMNAGGSPTGDARTTGGQLECEDGALVRCQVPHPQGKSAKIVTVDLKWENNIIARVDLGSGYALFDESAGEIRIYDASDTLLDTTSGLPVSDDALHTVTVCFTPSADDSDGVLTASMGSVCAQDLCPDNDDPFVYLGADSGTVRFDNIVFQKHEDTSEPKDENCSDCGCPILCPACADGNGPEFWIAYLTGFTAGTGSGGASCSADCTPVPNVLNNKYWIVAPGTSLGPPIACKCSWLRSMSWPIITSSGPDGIAPLICEAGDVNVILAQIYIWIIDTTIYAVLTFQPAAGCLTTQYVVFSKTYPEAIDCMGIQDVELPLHIGLTQTGTIDGCAFGLSLTGEGEITGPWITVSPTTSLRLSALGS